MQNEQSSAKAQVAVALAALGVVYGDIGTSPLYAMRECFFGPHAIAANGGNLLGVMSLILWSLVLIVSLKYLVYVLRADNHGEGGILALMALAVPSRMDRTKRSRVLLALGVFGAALLYGDGAITPAVTVLSAVEGLEVATPVFKPYLVPIAVVILFGLFLIQKYGTGKVGAAFGPVMVLWFVSLALLGITGLMRAPEVLGAISPVHAVRFFLDNGWHAFVVIGAIFLVVTGAEALYADMGHFGVKPIRRAWFALVFPALVLNYFGQAALMLKDPTAAENPFFKLAPGWAQYPLVALATAAAVIASQALISGVFSLTMQAVQLGFLPRLLVTHTSSEQRGQIYVPLANWMLLPACLVLVVGFGSSTRLAAAYGVAVTLTMVTTTVLFYFVAQRLWNWSRLKATAWAAGFLSMELAFFAANMLKLWQGGWVPLAIGAVLFTLMATWRKGRLLLGEKLRGINIPLTDVIDDFGRSGNCSRVPGTAIFMAGNANGTPLALLHNLKHNHVLHERNVVLTIVVGEQARVEEEDRIEIEKLRQDFYRVVARYGFMEQPSVPAILKQCGERDLKFVMERTTFFLSSETIVPGRCKGIAPWRARVFALLSRNSQRATTFFGLPPNRVVELGMQVEL